MTGWLIAVRMLEWNGVKVVKAYIVKKKRKYRHSDVRCCFRRMTGIGLMSSGCGIVFDLIARGSGCEEVVLEAGGAGAIGVLRATTMTILFNNLNKS
jgi:hypothetical protein